MVSHPEMNAFSAQAGALWVNPDTAGPMLETQAFGANPGNLRMLSYAPPGLPPGSPLVVVLHGCTQGAAANASGAGWLELADRYGFAVLCPDQQAANNPNRCFNWFRPQDVARGGGEAASIRHMVEAAARLHDIDRDRIFVSGLSAGGAMAAAMLAAYPEVFAGGGVIAGLPYGAAASVQDAFGVMMQGRSRSSAEWGDAVRGATKHAGPWPRLSIWQGAADSTVNPINAEALAQQWADVQGLAAGPTRSTRMKSRRRDVWLAPDGEPVLELNLIDHLGHGTPLATTGPDASGAAGPFLLEAGVSSSLELLRFWGLAEGPGAARPAREARPAPSQGLFDVQGAIVRALTAAGLLR